MKRLPLLLLLFLWGCEASPPAPNAGAGSGAAPAPQWADDEPQAAPVSRLLPLPEVPDAQADVTRNFYFVIDGSDSMKYSIDRTERSTLQFRDRMTAAKFATQEFLKTVPDDANIGLFVFDAFGFREVVPLGMNNRGEFAQAIREIQPGNNTPLGESIEKASEALFLQRAKQLDYGDYRLVVVTDGDSNGNVRIPDAADFAERRQVPIYTIGLCMTQDHELRRFSVSYKAADSAEDLKRGLEEAIGESTAFDPASFEPPKGLEE